MGLVYSHVRRKLIRFNAENRAHRFIEREKPIPPPRYPTEEKIFKQLEKEGQTVKNELNTKHERLNDYLKQVYVTSIGPAPEIKRNVDKLPKNRQNVESGVLGFEVPKTIPPGFCSLTQAMQFIAEHQNDPDNWSAKRISEDYKIDETKIETILKYYKTFNIYIPRDQKKKSVINQISGLVISGKKEIEKT